MNRIRLLPELVINQIAAGEVIERPASIVKELVENSIDANSSVIRIYLENGGISSIKVVDNGVGIHPEDLPLLFLQHATSKITSALDLNNINSLGFRGEALASIASVTNTVIHSQQNEPRGTTIEVKDLFYNTPVRRKFLRSSKTEFNYVQEIFKRICLSNFSIKFMLYHNNKLIKNLPACATDEAQKKFRLIKLCGKKFVDNAVFFNISQNGLTLFGWISIVESVAGTGLQYFYVNNRIIKDKLLSSALRQATQKLNVPQAYCLYLELDPMLVDVNVHPAKQEVRFMEPKIIYAFVYQNVLDVLSNKNTKNNLIHSELIVTDNIEVMESNVIQQQNKENIKLFSLFNNKYILFELEPLVIRILNTIVGIKWLLTKKLQRTTLLFNYYLIIPERVKIENLYNTDNVDQYINLLKSFKFLIDQIHDDILLIRAIPDCLNNFNVKLDYKNFLVELFALNLTLLNKTNIINLLIANISIDQYDFYTKNDLIIIIKELIIEKYNFLFLDEKQFINLLKL